MNDFQFDWGTTFEEKKGNVLSWVSRDDWTSRSGADILNDLKSQGLGIRESDFYSIRRDALELVRGEEQIRNLREETVIPERWVTEVPGWNLKRGYMYQVEVQGQRSSTGEGETRYFNLTSDQPLSIGQIQDEIGDLLDELGAEYDFEGDEFSVFRVFGRGDRLR